MIPPVIQCTHRTDILQLAAQHLTFLIHDDLNILKVIITQVYLRKQTDSRQKVFHRQNPVPLRHRHLLHDVTLRL